MDSLPVSSKRPAGRNDVDARLAQVEAILAAVAETVSAAARASERRSIRAQDDPVALTQALHPRGSRPSRAGAKERRGGGAGLIETRFVLFDGARRPEHPH